MADEVKGLRRLRSGKALKKMSYSGGNKKCACGYRVRGPNHENGSQHKKGKK